MSVKERRIVKASGNAPCARCDGPLAAGEDAVFRVGGVIHLACDEMLTTMMASVVLGIPVSRLRRLVARHAISPDGTKTNPHYKTGPPMMLWHAASVVGKLREHLPTSSAPKAVIEARCALWQPVWTWFWGLEDRARGDVMGGGRLQLDPMDLIDGAEAAKVLLHDEAEFLRGSEMVRNARMGKRA